MSYTIDYTTSSGESRPREGDMITFSVTRNDTSFSEEVHWKVSFPGDANSRNLSMEEDDIEGSLTGVLHFDVGAERQDFNLSTVDDDLVETSFEFMDIGLLNKNTTERVYVDDNDRDGRIELQPNQKIILGIGQYNGLDVYAELNTDSEYIISMKQEENQDTSWGSFALYDPWGTEIEDYTPDWSSFVFSPETTGIHRIEVNSGYGHVNYELTIQTTSDSNRAMAQSHLDSLGISMTSAADFLTSHMDRPQTIFDVAVQNDISAAMLAGIVNTDVFSVQKFFENSGLDVSLI